MIGFFNGMRVVEAKHLTKTKSVINRNPRQFKRKRSVKRLKCRPVRFITVPSSEIILDKSRNIMYAHPAMIKKLRDEIKPRADMRFNTSYSAIVNPMNSFNFSV